jgi:hypothetical protein
MDTAVKVAPRADFYVTGGTLRRDALCYVVRKADEELHEGLKHGKFCYLLTARQMGKSSLMVRRPRACVKGVVALDLTAIGQNLTAEQWYDGLLSRIGQQLELEEELDEFWLGHMRLGPLQRWMAAIRQAVLPVIQGRWLFSSTRLMRCAGCHFRPTSFLLAFGSFTTVARKMVG